MHGLVNRSIQSFLTDTHGEGFWSALAARIGLPECGFEPMLAYDDKLTDAVLDQASRRLALPREALLEDLGTYLVSHPRMERLRRLLRFGGANFLDFLQSLDDMPGRGRLAVPELDLPALEVHDQGAGRFLLQVRGGPPGSPEILTGVLRAMADDYGALAVIEPIASPPEESGRATSHLVPRPRFGAFAGHARQRSTPEDGTVDSGPLDGATLSEDIRTRSDGLTDPPDGVPSVSRATGCCADAPAQGQSDPPEAATPQQAGHMPLVAGASAAALPAPDRTGPDAGSAETPDLAVSVPHADGSADAPDGQASGDGASEGRFAALTVANNCLALPDTGAVRGLAPEDAGASASVSGTSGAGARVAWLQIVLHDPAFATGRHFDLTVSGRG